MKILLFLVLFLPSTCFALGNGWFGGSNSRSKLGTFTASSATITDLNAENLNVTGNTTLGDASGDTVTVNGGVTVNNSFTAENSTPTFSSMTVTNQVNSASFKIGANDLTTTEWANLDGQDQGVKTIDAPTFDTVNTGQGANELYQMNQDVETNDSVSFANATVTNLIKSDDDVVVSDNIAIGTDTISSYPAYVFNGDAGNVAASTEADDIVIEGNGTDVGLSFLGSSSSEGNIFFGRDGENAGGRIKYNHSDNALTLWAEADNVINILSTKRVGIGSSVAPEGTLHVLTNSAGTVTANAQADDFIVEQNADGGMSIITPATDKGCIFFARDGENASGRVIYDHNDDDFSIWVEGVERFTLDASGNLSSVATLDTGQGANELYDMDQNVLTTSSPTFASVTVTNNVSISGTLSTPSVPNSLEVTDAVTSTTSFVVIQSTGNAILLTSNPCVTAGTTDGQRLTIMGLSDTNTVELPDGNGVELAGGVNFNFGVGDVLELIWYNSNSKWYEVSRSDN